MILQARLVEQRNDETLKLQELPGETVKDRSFY